jgi:hypothetical protein
MAVVQYTYTHTDNTGNDTKQATQKIYRRTQKNYVEQHKN